MLMKKKNQKKLKYIKIIITKITLNQKRKYYLNNYSKIYNQKMIGKYYFYFNQIG